MKIPTTIKQIANNQRAYIVNRYSVEENVQLATNKALTATKVTDFFNEEELKRLAFCPKILYVLFFSPVYPKLWFE